MSWEYTCTFMFGFMLTGCCTLVSVYTPHITTMVARWENHTLKYISHVKIINHSYNFKGISRDNCQSLGVIYIIIFDATSRALESLKLSCDVMHWCCFPSTNCNLCLLASICEFRQAQCKYADAGMTPLTLDHMGDCTPDMGNATEVNDVDTFIITAYPSGADPGFFSRGRGVQNYRYTTPFNIQADFSGLYLF